MHDNSFNAVKATCFDLNMQSEVELCFALWFHTLQLCYPKLGKMFSDMNVLQA